MLGAVIGDIIGSRFEFDHKSTKFDLFTSASHYGSATIATTAIAEWILDGCAQNPAIFLQKWGKRYPHPHGGYSVHFNSWLWQKDPQPYGSFSCGAAMRVSAVAWAFNNLTDTLNFACDSAKITHDHTEGIKGAQALAATIFWARTGESKSFIQDNIARLFQYDVGKSSNFIRLNYEYHTHCQKTIPQAISVFLESETFEQAIRLAISLGGNNSAIATLVGSIAEAYYRGMAPYIKQRVLRILPEDIAAILLQIPM